MQNKILNFKPKYSIVCLIYKSNEWLDFVYNQVIKYTDFEDTEFFFIANNATDEVKEYLKNNYIPHYVYDSNEEQKSEWYINNVYRWYNYWAEMAKWEFLIFINSDMTFSPNWLENLISKYNWKNCIASRLIESWKFSSWKYWLEKNFWTEFFNYEEEKFINYSNSFKENWICKNWWLYMPLFINKKDFFDVWAYPEWNILEWSDINKPIIAKKWEKISFTWDEALIEKLRINWIEHMTSFDSIIYHFQAWELSYNKLNSVDNKLNICIYNDLVEWTMWEKVLWNYLIDKLPWNVFWIDKKIVWENWVLEEKANEYLQKNHPNTDIIIQNATFISKMNNNIPTFSYLQDDIRKMWQNTIFQENNLKKSELIVTNSIYTAESYSEFDSEIIPIWVNNELFKVKDKEKIRKEYNLPEWIIWIFVWSLSDTKWWNEIEKIIKTNNNVNHWIVISKYDEIYTFEKVSFFSKIDQQKLSDLLNCADFFILWSKVETQCLAALEAALCNLPIIMRNIWIFREFSDLEKNYIWEFSDNFNESINKVILNIGKYKPRETIINKNLDIDWMINNWIKLISRFIILKKQNNSLLNNKIIKNKLSTKIELFIRLKLLWKFWLQNLTLKMFLNINNYKYLFKIILKKIWIKK